MPGSDEQSPTNRTVSNERGNMPAATRRRVRRRRLIKGAAVAGAGVLGASGVYITPSVRPLEMPTAQAFSF